MANQKTITALARLLNVPSEEKRESLLWKMCKSANRDYKDAAERVIDELVSGKSGSMDQAIERVLFTQI